MAFSSRVRIPATEKHPLKVLDQLSDEDFEKYLTILDLAAPSLRADDFANQVRLLWTAPERSASIKGITEMATRAARTAVRSALPISEIADALLAVEDDSTPEIEGTEDSPKTPIFSDHLKGRLLRVFGMKNLQITAQAALVQTAQQNPAQDLRIFSDIRPIFLLDQSEQVPVASVIIHQLQIRVSVREGVRDEYYALDESDLIALGAAVEAALKRADGLRESEFASGRLLIKA